ncbi:MAG TPA: CHC2 zinc finger domain-containing protein [Aequorivita sp.]|nr:CHC2 zinc finger domain-containing protein [Aequorivita sp.]
MNIPSLKSKLDILQIGEELGIKIDKHGKAHCPFHNDKTPSFQFSKEKQIVTCFSANCSAGTMDVVELVKKYKSLELPKALDWLQERTNGVMSENLTQSQTTDKVNYQSDFQQMQSSFVASSTARKYAESRNLDWKSLEIGYNAFKSSRFNYLRGCITFPLKNEKGDIVSLYGRSVRSTGGNHFYSKNRSGLYPGYPNRGTKKLILTESVIDTASLLNNKEITESYALLSLYGTNGLTAEHVHAIQQIESLEEIVLFFDGDESGKEANQKHAKYLKSLFSETTIRIVQTPDGTDINELAQSHQPELFIDLIQKSEVFFFSVESLDTHSKEQKPVENKNLPESQNTYKLGTNHRYNLKYQTDTAKYEIKGGIGKNGLDRLVISLHIIHLETRKKSRVRLDLYEDKQVEKIARESSEKLELRADLLEQDLNYLADLLDEYREQVIKEKEEKEQEKHYIIPEIEKEEAFKLLKSDDLIQKINELIGQSGVIGEQGNRVFLFCIAVSHKFENTLHALVQGSSGSGKTHLVRQITDFMPLENVIRLTRVTESSFYNYGEYDLQNKLVVIEDYDGLKEEAELAFRELQSNDELRSSVSAKDTEYGSYRTQIRVVKGPISSMAATTKGAIYEDNLSRCFVIAVDESKEQTAKIIDYQNKKAAGEIKTNQKDEIQTLLQNCIRLLKPMEVINPFASKMKLPEEAFKIRRLNSNFQSFVKQITLLNQYQRQKDKQGRLITAKEDLQIAIEIMFDSIILKVDELDGSLRDFYEKLKEYVQTKGKEYEFTQREIRQDLRISKTQMQRFINDLLELEYIERKGAGMHGATKYKISYWDDNTALKQRIKDNLNTQLAQL